MKLINKIKQLINSNDSTQLLFKSFPPEFKDSLKNVIKLLPSNIIVSKHSSLTVILNKNRIEIPYRIHLDEINQNKLKNLTKTEQLIICCIYSRNGDGYIRQRAFEQLLEFKDDIVVPYAFCLLSEYVLEIIEVFLEKIDKLDLVKYKEFITNNPRIFNQILKQRMISYWDVYYRYAYLDIKKYPGYIIFNKIENETNITIQKNKNMG